MKPLHLPLLVAITLSATTTSHAVLVGVNAEYGMINNSAGNPSLGFQTYLNGVQTFTTPANTLTNSAFLASTESNFNATSSDSVTYIINFPVPGVYNLFELNLGANGTETGWEDGPGGTSGNNDSFFFETSPGSGPGSVTTINGGTGTGAWDWDNRGTVTVTTPGVQSWTIWNREDGHLIDAFVFAGPDMPNPTDEMLLRAIPEPSRAMIIALGLAPLMLRRRR